MLCANPFSDLCIFLVTCELYFLKWGFWNRRVNWICSPHHVMIQLSPISWFLSHKKMTKMTKYLAPLLRVPWGPFRFHFIKNLIMLLKLIFQVNKHFSRKNNPPKCLSKIDIFLRARKILSHFKMAQFRSNFDLFWATFWSTVVPISTRASKFCLKIKIQRCAKK